MNPLISIGLCVKNEEKNIRATMSHLINQNFPHNKIEIIIVDGYSVDDTVNIINNCLKDSDYSYKIIYENKGLGNARQIVIQESVSDYVLWVDGDILLSPNYINYQYNFMENNENVGVAIGSYGIYGENIVDLLENYSYVVDSYRWAGHEHPRLLGTEGSIFRMKAIRQVNGFDSRIQGACEDIDLVYRIRQKGWKLYMTKAIFYEKCKQTWKGLWDQYVWWGKGGHFLNHKNKRINPVYEMIPPAGFYAGLNRMFTAYSITQDKKSFFMPIHYLFKRFAWCYGFIKAHYEGYGHIMDEL